MTLPLMPKATAVWLVENTRLTFTQIAAFCGLHELEVQAIADGEVAVGLVGLDPLANGQLTQEEIERCEADPAERLTLSKSTLPQPTKRQKGPRYTPVTKRGDKPDAIAWLVREHPELSDAAISRLIGTTKQTINAVRNRTHWNSPNIKPRSPMTLGLCASSELSDALAKSRKRAPQAPPPSAAVAEGAPAASEDDVLGVVESDDEPEAPGLNILETGETPIEPENDPFSRQDG